MIEQDRVLLGKIFALNFSIAQTAEMLLGEDLAEGQPAAEGLRTLADQLKSVETLLRDRADQLDNTVDAEAP